MITNKIIFICIVFLSICEDAIAQAPSIQWKKTYGGSAYDEAHSICNTRDGGFVAVGSSSSIDGDVTNNHGNGGDVWIIKIDNLSNLQWNKCLGGTLGEVGYSILQTFDGGFAIAGYTNSNDGDVSGLHGGTFGRDDFWVVKTDSLGGIQWQKCFGTAGDEEAYEITETNDSGYLVTGYMDSNNGDNFIVKIDQYGIQQWANVLGGSDYDIGYSCKQSLDGGYLIAGMTFSIDGNLTGVHTNSSPDVWVIKLNVLGQMVWQKCYGGSAGDSGNEIILSNNGGFFVSATTTSNNNDVSGNHGSGDYWLFKADDNGIIQWEKCFGGIDNESSFTASPTSDGGIVIIGVARVDDGMVSGTHGFEDYWVVKIDSSGNYQWSKSLGGSAQDRAYAVRETPDGGYILAGYTESNNGDVTFNHGGRDFWIVKLAPVGLLAPEIQNTLIDLNIIQSDNQLNLRFFSRQNGKAEMFFYDLAGKQITEKYISVSEGINYDQINCSDLAKGMYFVKIDSGKSSQLEKVFIE